MQFLEARLIALARAAKRLPLDSANQPSEPSLSEADRADMDVFLNHMLGMLPVLGVHAFELPKRALESLPQTRVDAALPGVSGANTAAPAVDNGVLVQAGDSYRFTQDYVFSSPSYAAALVLGRGANGRVMWKDAEGRTLKALQEAEANQG